MISEISKIGIENQKQKQKYYYSTINKDFLNFPNIDNYNKYNDNKKIHKLRIRNHNNYFRNIIKLKSLKYDIKNNSIEKSNQNLLEIKKYETILPKSEFKKNKKFISTFENKRYKTISYNNYNDDIKESNLVLSSIRIPKINLFNYNNISYINNIHNKEDYFKFIYSQTDKNNQDNSLITINHLKSCRTGKNLFDERKNLIELLNRKSSINFKLKISYSQKHKKKKHKGEFKKYFEEMLNQCDKTNLNKKFKTKYLITELEDKKSLIKKNKTKNEDIYLNKIKNNKNIYFNGKKGKEKDIFNTTLMKSWYLKSKINKENKGTSTDDNNLNKNNNMFYMYLFKRNQKMMNNVEQEMTNIKNNLITIFNNYKKDIDNETANLE